MSTKLATDAIEDPVVEFSARVDGECVLVRVMRSGLVWAVVDDPLVVVEMMPTASITDVTTEPGRFRSTLTVEADGRKVAFSLENARAREGRESIRLLMAVYGPVPESFHPKVVGEDSIADELIALRSSLDAGTVDAAEYGEQRARLLGF